MVMYESLSISPSEQIHLVAGKRPCKDDMEGERPSKRIKSVEFAKTSSLRGARFPTPGLRPSAPESVPTAPFPSHPPFPASIPCGLPHPPGAWTAAGGRGGKAAGCWGGTVRSGIALHAVRFRRPERGALLRRDSSALNPSPPAPPTAPPGGQLATTISSDSEGKAA
jgi:hypothetical protein